MAFDVKQAFAENRVVLIIMPNATYMDNILMIVRQLGEAYDKILYVTVNKPYSILKKEFEKNKIDARKFIFIDAITQMVSNERGMIDNCFFVSGPTALTEISTISTALQEKYKPDTFFFDSLSSLLVYSNPHNIIRFAHTIITKLEIQECKTLLPCLKDEENPMFLKDLEMFVDEVVDLSR